MSQARDCELAVWRYATTHVHVIIEGEILEPPEEWAAIPRQGDYFQIHDKVYLVEKVKWYSDTGDIPDAGLDNPLAFVYLINPEPAMDGEE